MIQTKDPLRRLLIRRWRIERGPITPSYLWYFNRNKKPPLRLQGQWKRDSKWLTGTKANIHFPLARLSVTNPLSTWIINIDNTHSTSIQGQLISSLVRSGDACRCSWIEVEPAREPEPPGETPEAPGERRQGCIGVPSRNKLREGRLCKHHVSYMFEQELAS
jgi:hypothetical protein